jgi:hypothetical protein
MKITRFCIGKERCYKGLAIRLGWFKFERIGFGKKFMWRFEFSNWEE